MHSFLSYIAYGVTQLPWWGYLIVGVVLTQITIVCVTVDLHPIASHFFRFWLWMTTGMQTRDWVAIHRKHHAKCETAEDPHSPQIKGLRAVLWRGAELYMAEKSNQETLARYGHGTPNDWVERNVYSRWTWQGCGVMLVADVVLFGAAGLVVWAVQMLWIPFFAAGVINGIGHFWG